MKKRQPKSQIVIMPGDLSQLTCTCHPHQRMSEPVMRVIQMIPVDERQKPH